jgi:hypothetical protein
VTGLRVAMVVGCAVELAGAAVAFWKVHNPGRTAPAAPAPARAAAGRRHVEQEWAK